MYIERKYLYFLTFFMIVLKFVSQFQVLFKIRILKLKDRGRGSGSGGGGGGGIKNL